MIRDEDLARWFGVSEIDDPQIKASEEIRVAGLAFATVILRCSPSSADQTAAMRKVREAVWSAVAAVALEKKE